MIVFVIFIFLLFFVFGVHLIYPFILKKLSHKFPAFNSYNTSIVSDMSQSETHLPHVSIIIPVHNEQAVIERRINNVLDSSFPKEKIEIIIVDSGSSDKTISIIEEKFLNAVVLIKEERRRGKAHAINLALKIAKGDIVIITDGPTLYDKHTISQMVYSLKNRSVGGAAALYNIPNAMENKITQSEHTFWVHKENIRILESRVYSTSWLSGEACAFKKNIINNVDEDSLADDSNIALQIISKGYRAVINENAFFTEKSPSEAYDYFKIKSRRALGGLLETLKFRIFLFNRQYGYFGLVIFPYRFFAQVISPIGSLLAMVLFIPAVLELVTYYGLYAPVLIGAALFYLALQFRNKFLAYFNLQIISIMALLMLLTKKGDVLWEQSRTTRQ